MFKEVLDWVSLFAGILTIFAASATLYAVWIAHTTWKTWKTQQNYSFARDKIFEVELSASDYFEVLSKYIELNFELRIHDLQNKVHYAAAGSKQKIIDKEAELKDVFEYKLKTLKIINVDYSFISKLENFQKELRSSLLQVENEADLSLIDSSKIKFLDENEVLKKNILNALRKIRENL